MSIGRKKVPIIKKSEINKKKDNINRKKFNSSVKTIRQYNIYNHIMIVNKTNFFGG